MKVGDVIINPYVREKRGDIVNPLHRTMVIKIVKELTTALTYRGEIAEWYTSHCKKWEVSHHVNIEEMILGSDAYEQEWMKHE